ncbi:MAG: putative integral membrane protein [Myxococcota bacterium]|jgi:uncharacterized integral membrane protein
MADPHHVEVLDAHDRRTVLAYRAGLLVSAVGLSWSAAAQLTGEGEQVGWALVVIGTALAIANVHLYAKSVRWAIRACGVGGLAVLAVGGWPLAEQAGHGLLFVSLSALAFKEWFCFRIPGLRLMPLLLAAAVLARMAGAAPVAGALLGASGALYAVLAVGKLRQPLHFDVGDKSQYEA